MGANDVANAFGTSVGSNVLTIRNAFILATIMETLGAMLVGSNVTATMSKKVVNIDLYIKHPDQFFLGQLAILGGGSVWLVTATLLRLPVSSTHSIVGATLGFTLVLNGIKGISWWKILEIALSWVLSPALSGFVSATLYMIVDFAVLRRRNPVKCGLRALPFFYFFCIAFNSFAIVKNGSQKLEHVGLIAEGRISVWVLIMISIGFGVVAALISHFILRPRILRWIYRGREEKINEQNDEQNDDESNEWSNLSSSERLQSFRLTPRGLLSWFFPRKDRKENKDTLRMFSTIQVFTACFAAFAHGANDVSNSISPLVAMLSVWIHRTVKEKEDTSPWLLLFGVFSICLGLWILGHRVIEMVGQKLSQINPCSGFTIEFGAAFTVVLASELGLPVSTTHCLVGSVVAVGTINSGEGIDWRHFGSIAKSWLVTLPVSGAISAALMFILKVSLLTYE
ncbi:hypothetical protein niasHS_011058 [Heterodera schachtii]|uniref:Phosphate transporter n=1 Tax=Heterodera schachtii TaxID=97005 RepID=A0ABD2IVA5_HETSC